MITNNIKQSERLIKLNECAREQLHLLVNNQNIRELELLQTKVNKEEVMIANK